MFILMPNGHKNITQYSIISENKDSNRKIIDGMVKRFKTNPNYFIANVIQFYDQPLDKLIETIKLK